VCHSSPFRLYKFSESCTIAEIFLAPFSSSFILHLPVSSASLAVHSAERRLYGYFA
jgi:hypothetical protein